MSELNGQIRTVNNPTAFSFQIGDTSSCAEPYRDGGRVTQVNEPKPFHHVVA